MEAKTVEVAGLEPGQQATFTVAHPDGETTVVDVTVEMNTIGRPDNHMFGVEKLKAYTSKKRYGRDIVAKKNGVCRVKPRFNANGQGSDGVIVDVELK